MFLPPSRVISSWRFVHSLCRTVHAGHVPLAIRLLKSAFNADVDGQAGLQELAGNATMLFYMTEQGQEGKNAYLEKRPPNFRQYPWLPW